MKAARLLGKRAAFLSRSLAAVLFVRALNGVARRRPFSVSPSRKTVEAAFASKVTPAIDRYGLTIDVVSARPHQQHGEITELMHLTDARHDRGIIRIVRAANLLAGRQALPGSLSWERPGRNRVEANAVAPPLHRQRLRHHIETGLRHG